MRYKITVLVESESLGPAITALTPLAVGPIVSAVSGEGRGGKGARHTREVRSTPIQDSCVGKLILGALGTGPCSHGDLASVLAEQGYRATSVSPSLTKLRRAGLVRDCADRVDHLELVS